MDYVTNHALTDMGMRIIFSLKFIRDFFAKVSNNGG